MPLDGNEIEYRPITRVLTDAYARLEAGFWPGPGSRGRLPEGPAVCMIAALHDSPGITFELYAAAQPFLLAAIQETGFTRGRVVEYSDSHTKDEVLAVYQRAIELSWQA
jgi:hypothetical protein